MSLFCSSRGSIQSISLITIAILVLAGAWYFGYNYYISSTTPIAVAPIDTIPIETPTILMKDTTSQEVLISGIVGNVSMITASGDIALTNDKVVTLEQSIFYTTTNSRMSIIFPDRSIVRLDSDSRVKLEQWVDGNIIVSVQNGRIWARVIGAVGWTWALTLSLGNTKALVLWTSIEAVKLPLYSKYVVLDSASNDPDSAGVDVIDASGSVTRVTPENKWIGTEFGTSYVKSINVDDIYENDAFALMNTQEDIIHLQDALVNHSGSIDSERVQREILASIPPLWTEESIAFFSGTTIGSSDLSGDMSSQEWSEITQKVLTERMDEYVVAIQQNNLYLNQITQDQNTLLSAIMKINRTIPDDTKETMEWLLREQETLLSNILMQNEEFIDKINQDVRMLLQNLWLMVSDMIEDTMNLVDTTLNSISQDRDASTDSVQQNIPTLVPSSSQADLESFQKQDSEIGWVVTP